MPRNGDHEVSHAVRSHSSRKRTWTDVVPGSDIRDSRTDSENEHSRAVREGHREYDGRSSALDLHIFTVKWTTSAWYCPKRYMFVYVYTPVRPPR